MPGLFSSTVPYPFNASLHSRNWYSSSSHTGEVCSFWQVGNLQLLYLKQQHHLVQRCPKLKRNTHVHLLYFFWLM